MKRIESQIFVCVLRLKAKNYYGKTPKATFNSNVDPVINSQHG